MNKLQLITAICAASSAFLFGLFSLSYGIAHKDPMLIPFTLIGFAGSLVMWANRK